MELSQYTGVQVNYTGRYIVKCAASGHTQECTRRAVWNPKEGPQPSLHCRGSVKVQEILGSYSEKKQCDPRCMGATGPNCDCSCAGSNHGIAA